jgi:hypothetical protein
MIDHTKMIWEQKELTLKIVNIWNYSNPGHLNEETLLPVQQWSNEHDCGVRTSFDTWRFRNNAEITAFLLRWA